MPINWRPFKELERPDHMPDVFGQDEWMPFMPGAGTEEPAIDIYQDKTNLYIEVSLGVIKPENMEVSIEDNMLIIQGKVEEGKQIKEKDYLRKEIKKGSFRRIVKLPVEVKGGQAKAESFGGVLKITVPKLTKANRQTKKVPIKIK